MGMRFKIFLVLFMGFTFGMMAFQPVRVWPASLDIRVSSNKDDAEERLVDGYINRWSGELDIVQEDDGTYQLVGIRFRDVTIPQGAVITNVYIKFKANGTNTDTANLTFEGEASDNPDIFEYGEDNKKNISNRERTDVSVSWSNVPSWYWNEEYQSPDLSPIVQEIVNRSGWSSGNAMVFIISGSGKRKAVSHNGNSSAAPILHIEYQSYVMDIQVSWKSDDAEEKTDGGMILNSNDLDMIRDYGGAEYTVGIRFQDVDVPRGAHITKAYIKFQTASTSGGEQKDATDLTIEGEASNNASTFTNSKDNITDRPRTSASVSWKNIPEWKEEPGDVRQTPDLSSIVKEIIGRSGWSEGNALAFIISGEFGRRVAKSRDEGQKYAPVLHLEYSEEKLPYISVDKNILGAVCYQGNSPPSDSIILTNTGSDLLSYTISDDADWVSCSSGGGLLSPGDSVTITVDYNTTSLDAGTHEATITVSDPDGRAPNSPFEIDVSVTIQALPKSTACGHVPVYTENLVHPAILILLDLSGSMDNLMPVFDPETNPRTPDLKMIVQEIVDRSGWTSGNAMVFIITGSGHRTAVSYDGTTGLEPLLHVEYTHEGFHKADIRVSQSSDDAEEEKSDGDINLTSTDLDLIKSWGKEQIVGIRFQNVPIPQGAAITNAYIEFVVNEGQSESTSLTIRGEDLDNPPTFSDSTGNISERTTTDAFVSWNNIPAWIAPTKQQRIEIARSVISDLVKDKSIAWGFGTWRSQESAGYIKEIDYTKIHDGCKPNDPNHQAALQNSISTKTNIGGYTPFGPSLVAAQEYFLGKKKDKEGTGDYYIEISCQPRFLIEITDGLGNVDSTDELIRKNTEALCDYGVTPIAVGFGIDDATQIQIMAKVSNERGHASEDLFALHDEEGGVGQPFLAYSQGALIEALATITERIKAQIFHGAAPVPTTSLDHGDIVIIAEFDATDWSGDLVANKFNPSTKKWDTLVWRASDALPFSRKVFTISPSDPDRVIDYTDSVLSHDNWLCKDIGDIINSNPIMVGSPPFYYDFDGYESWKKGIHRDPIIYVGANDGALHAFQFSDGVEDWAFFPKSSHEKLDKADDPVYDMCSKEYCHQYFVDGSPQVGDIYTGTHWMTILVCGLREGGESYFALDITYGKPFGEIKGTEYLWEFTDSELGQTWADPSIDRVSYGIGATWGVFFGSGYAVSDQANKEAYLYGIEADNNAPLWNNGTDDINRIKIASTTLKDDALASPLVADLDGDYRSDRIYVGNLYGTMFRIMTIGKGEMPIVTKLFDFGHSSHINAIRAKATYAYDVKDDTIWIYFGTGKYETQMDKTSMHQQYFFGLKDSITFASTYAMTELVQFDTDEFVYTNPDTYEERTVKVIEGENNSKASWVVRLENSAPGMIGSERVIEQPLVVAGIVYFTTFVPDQDICAGNGNTWVYALEYDTGLPPITPVFDLNEDGVFNEKDKVEDHLGEKHNVAGMQVGSGQGSEPVLHKDTLFITTTNEDVTALKVNLPKSKARVRSWKDNTL